MSGYQFIHIESYARISSKNGKKQSAKNVAAEAERELYACKHIDDPKPYIHLYGCSPNQAVTLAQEQADIAIDKIGRKLRIDAQIIVSGVASYPIPLAQLTPSDPSLKKWLKLTHQFLLGKYGNNYKSLCFHHDETYPHVHFTLIPELAPNGHMSVAEIHDGVKARNEVTTGRAKDKVRAYKKAMMAFQQDYFEKVGKPCGLCKEGPKKRRLTRKLWQAEKSAAQRQAEAFTNIQLAESSLHASQLKLDNVEQRKHELKELEDLIKAKHAKAIKEKEELITIKANGNKSIISYLKDQVIKLKDKLSKLMENVNKLKSLNKNLGSEVSTLEKENTLLRKQNSKLNYQNNIRLKGIKRLKSELYYVLGLSKLGQYKKIDEISNNNNIYQEYQL